MKIYRFLSKYSISFQHNGKKLEIERYGWSNESQENATECAKQRCLEAKKAYLEGAEYKRDGHYYSASSKIYEQSLEWFDDLNVINTINTFGATCLNVENVMILDIDDEDLEKAIPKKIEIIESENWFWRFLGLGIQRVEKPTIEPLTFLLNKFSDFIRQYPRVTFNLYRTYAGYRAIVLHDIFEIDDERISSYFNSLLVDKLYTRLCYTQRCFRARLTPKPYRIGIKIVQKWQ